MLDWWVFGCLLFKVVMIVVIGWEGWLRGRQLESWLI